MRYYIVDAFTDKLFSGNPAGVCILEKDLPDETLQKIASENNLAETAFIQKKDDCYTLRWFTPEFEIDLCGHATLAAAYVVLNFIEPKIDAVSFSTTSGILSVQRENDSAYEMSLPIRRPQRIEITKEISKALGIVPIELYSERDLYAFVENESMVLDTGYLAAMSETCTMEIQTVKGVKNVLFGGEGFFNTVVKGPGKVYVQSMPISKTAMAIAPYIATGN